MVFSLTSENLTNIGGPMGNNSSSTNWVKYFSSGEKAKAFALKDYLAESNGKSGVSKFSWVKDGDRLRSPDLLFVMYEIKPVEIVE